MKAGKKRGFTFSTKQG